MSSEGLGDLTYFGSYGCCEKYWIWNDEYKCIAYAKMRNSSTVKDIANED